jgi:hypothetical protein
VRENTSADAITNAESNSCTIDQANTSAVANTNAVADSISDGVSHAIANSKPNTHPNTWANSESDSKANGQAHIHANTDANAASLCRWLAWMLRRRCHLHRSTDNKSRIFLCLQDGLRNFVEHRRQPKPQVRGNTSADAITNAESNSCTIDQANISADANANAVADSISDAVSHAVANCEPNTNTWANFESDSKANGRAHNTNANAASL